MICPLAGQPQNFIAYNDGDKLIIKNVKKKKELISVPYENVDKNILGLSNNDTILAILSIITKEEQSILIVSYTNAIVVYLLSKKRFAFVGSPYKIQINL